MNTYREPDPPKRYRPRLSVVRWLNRRIFHKPYASWRDLMHVSAITSLVDIIDEIMRDFSKTLILDLKARVLPYAPYFDALELINPTAPDKPVI